MILTSVNNCKLITSGTNNLKPFKHWTSLRLALNMLLLFFPIQFIICIKLNYPNDFMNNSSFLLKKQLFLGYIKIQYLKYTDHQNGYFYFYRKTNFRIFFSHNLLSYYCSQTLFCSDTIRTIGMVTETIKQFRKVIAQPKSTITGFYRKTEWFLRVLILTPLETICKLNVHKKIRRRPVYMGNSYSLSGFFRLNV